MEKRIIALLLPFLILDWSTGIFAQNYSNWAESSLDSLLDKFWDGKDPGYLYNVYPNGFFSAYTFYWNYALAFDALLDGLELFGTESKYFPWIAKFYNGQKAIGWSRNYFDDENWMALALLRASKISAKKDSNLSKQCFETCLQLYEDIEKAWDETCCGSKPGGVWWDRSHTQKATASNGGPAILAARLYRETGDSKYLQFSEKVFNFWYDNMVDSKTGQVADHFDPNGSKLWWKFTYNEGLMIGAATELYSITGDSQYLNKAKLIYSFVVKNETHSSTYGHVLDDGSTCASDCVEFKGVAFRYIMRFYQVTKSSDILAFLKSCVDAIWNLSRNTKDTTFSKKMNNPFSKIILFNS